MNALFIVESIGFGHAVRSYEVMKEFKRKGYEVKAIASNSAAYFFKSKDIPVTDIPISIILKTNNERLDVGKTILEGIRVKNVTAVAAIGDVIKKEKPDVIIIDTSVIGVMAAMAAKEKTTPVLFISNDNAYMTEKNSGEKRRLFGIVDKFIRANVDEYIVPDFPPPYTISEYNLILADEMKFVGPLCWARNFSIPKKTRGTLVTEGKSEIVSERLREILKGIGNQPKEKDYEKKFLSAEVVVHHGGHTTAMDCIVSAKPQVVISLEGYAERMHNGKKIAKLGLGKSMESNKWLDRNSVEHAIEEAKNCKSNVLRFSRYARSYNAPKTIYELYESNLRK